MNAHDPGDPHALACVAADSNMDQALRAKAIEQLRPFHRRQAKSVACHLGNSDPASRDDAVGDVELALWEGKFRGDVAYRIWSWVHMRNGLVSAHRKRVRETPLDFEPIVPRPLSSAGELLGPFTPNDLAAIRGWPVSDRVLLLCQSLLWSKAPAAEWQAWLDELDIAAPFPPEGFDDLPLDEQNAILLAALRFHASNTLNQRSKRGWDKKLLRLDFVQGLL